MLLAGRAIEVDSMDVQCTITKLIFLWKLELDSSCTTTLIIVHIDSLTSTESHLVTRAALGHLIRDENVGLPRSGQMESPNREWSVGSIDLETIAIVTAQSTPDACSLNID